MANGDVKNMLCITHQQANANSNYKGLSVHTWENGYYREDRREYQQGCDGSADWLSHYGKHYAGA